MKCNGYVFLTVSAILISSLTIGIISGIRNYSLYGDNYTLEENR